MKIYIHFFILLILSISQAFGQNVNFRANAPNSVINGQQFQVEFVINNADAKNFRGPDFTGFEVKFGPTPSTSMSTRIINGQMSSQSAITFTYVLQAQKEGSFNIAPASISLDGKTYSSNALTIKVLPPDKNAPQNQNQNRNSGVSQGGLGPSAATSANVSSDNLFIRAITSKQSVYEQEAFLVSYKLYTRYESTQTDVNNYKFPDFEGFVVQEIEPPANKSWQLENYNGKNYYSVVLRQILLFPQRSGTLTIEPAKIGAIVGIYNPQAGMTPFGLPMGGVQEVKKTLMSSAVNITSKPLPSGKPASFSGTVGNIKMTASISPDKFKTNEAVTIKIVFEGTGNIKLLKNPDIKFPQDFETYDPKVDNKFSTTSSGMNGTKTIEYMAIPRHTGDFVIPSVDFSYFDLKSQTYKTESTPEFKLHVEKGSGNPSGAVVSNYTDQENLKFLNEDIRYIKTGNLHIRKQGEFIFGTLSYYLWYIIPLVLFIVLFILFRKQAKENANIALVRTKKANKVATKRLKRANIFLKENKKELFYDEVLKALWGYLSDKLNIPVSELSKNNVELELSRYGVDNSLITDFMDILNTCEFARYAPVDDNNSMDKIYQKAANDINRMENTIKRK